MMRQTIPSVLFLFLLVQSGYTEDQTVVNVPVWQEGQENGGWGGAHNATFERDPEGLILKAGDESYYGAVFMDLGEVDLDKYPFFIVEVDRADGSFSCKLTNRTKNDKQVIFSPGEAPTLQTRGFVSQLPSQTGWSGRVPLSIGLYCMGQGKSLRVRSIRFLRELTGEMMEKFSQVRNLLFDANFEWDMAGRPPMQTWHRLGGYLPDESPWVIVEANAFHGKQCAMTTTPGKLVLQREIHERGTGIYTFSVHLRAAKEGHKARLAVTTYQQGKPFITRTESKDIVVGKEWSRFDMTIDVPNVRGRGLLGATDLAIESLDDGELWADGLQFELGNRPTLYWENHTLLSCERSGNLRSPLYPAVTEPAAPAELPSGELGRVPFIALGGDVPPGERWPMSGTIALPPGVSYDIASWRLKNPQGACLPIQSRVLARWKGDGSIKAAEIVAESDGSKEWALEYNSMEPAPAIERPKEAKESITVGKVFFVTALNGQKFTNEEKPPCVLLEENGPVRTILRIEGSHRSAEGQELLSYVSRLHCYRHPDSPFPNLTRTEYTWVNTNASRSVVVSEMGLRVPLDAAQVKGATFFGADGKMHAVDIAKGGSLLQCDEKKKYFYEIRSGDSKPEQFEGKAEGRVRVDLGENILEVLVEDWWQNHPMELAVDGGGVTVFFWSPRVKAVELTKAMAKTYIVDVWHGPKEKAPQRMAGPTTLVAPTSIHCRSGVFGGTILPSEGSPFPIFEEAVNSQQCRARMDPDVMLATDSYGQFNFGDCMGDGGWANLETQRGHASWLHYLRTGDPRMFQVAQAAARHYRDIDIDQISGGTITHNPSHTLGSRSTSHAWIQGMLDHYMTTGERRSMEVALFHANFLKSRPVTELTTGGREVTRILDNLADLHMVTGDDDLVKKYHEIVAAQRENLEKGKTQFPGVFQAEREGKWTYPANFVPWYGLYSQVKMRLATGDASWEKAFEEEIGCAMAKLPFEYSRPEYFQGNKLTDDQRIVRCLAEGGIGDRGCMLFPALGYAHRWTNNKRYLEIGMATTYIAIISREYQDPLYALAGVFLDQAREAGLGAEDEKRYYQEAIDIMKGAAKPTLSNRGFEEGTKDWLAWSYKATTSSFWVPVREKCLKMDAAMKKEGKQSLHMVVRRDCPPWGSGIPLDSELFVMDKGRKYVFEGWIKMQGDVSAAVYLSMRPLSRDGEPQSIRGVIENPDVDGWRRWELEAEAQVDYLGRLTLGGARSNPKAEGDLWWDGITVK